MSAAVDDAKTRINASATAMTVCSTLLMGTGLVVETGVFSGSTESKVVSSIILYCKKIFFT